MKTWNVAFIGCGAIAGRHAQVLHGIPSVNIRSVWNRSPERAQALARECGARVIDDWRIACEDPHIDAIYINTMHNDRLRFIEAAAEARKPVFCEKPLAHTADDLDRMEKIIASSGLFFQAGFKTRFHSGMQAARAWLPGPEVIHAQVLDEKWPEGGLNDPAVGGGNIVSQGVYATEAAYLLAQSRPVSVTAMMRNARHPDGTPDSLCAVFSFANGAIATVTAADAGLSPDPVGKFFVTAAGGNRCLTIQDRYRNVATWDGSDRSAVTQSFEEDGFRIQSERFFAALDQGEPSPIPFAEGALPSRMVWAALEAARTGCAVTIRPTV